MLLLWMVVVLVVFCPHAVFAGCSASCLKGLLRGGQSKHIAELMVITKGYISYA